MILLLIIGIAVYGLIVSTNLIRKVMCLAIIESMIILTFLTIGYDETGTAPILQQHPSEITIDMPLVDPIPQALMLTAIVIGVCFNSLALVFIVRLHQHTGTIEVGELDER
ncbi:MAG: sodium:proton antiporter [Spirochaeta sp.]